MKFAQTIAFAVALAAVFLMWRQPSSAAQSTSASARTAPSAKESKLGSSMGSKLDHIQKNGAHQTPDQTPTIITEDEVNAWFAAGRVKLPNGVQHVEFHSTPGVITSLARVDFDQLTAKQRSSNPLLSIFTGVHNVQTVAHAQGEGGIGIVSVDSVSLDGTQIPRLVLQLFVREFITPKYPNVALDSHFHMPDRIDTATVGEHTLTITQK